MRPAIFTLLSACAASAQHIINLSDTKWTLTNGHNVTIPGNFPSQAHLDLFREGIIGDPLYGFNDVNQLWVERSNWTWHSEGISGLEANSQTRSWLVFQGLDTFAEIKLCNHLVANVANQFRQFSFDVTDILPKCSGEPTLSINFGSAAKIVLEIANSTGPGYINVDNNVDGQEFQGKIYMRKEQNDFGWDWSPSLAPAGPWRPAYVVQKSTSDPIYPQNTLIDIYRQGQLNNLPPDQSMPWVFNASIDFLGSLPPQTKMHLKLVDPSGKTVKSEQLGSITQNGMTITGHTVIREPVDLWWPNGMGSQPLYTATITLESPSWREPAIVTKRVGFRTIVLNLGPITQEQLAAGVAPGSNWHFEINGHEMYAKGANFVPVDVFWSRVNSTTVHELFDLVVTANQNMLRVWASGAYLSDEIYDLADEMGILLWTEFEFSDAEYPVLDNFLEEYEAEAYYNVRRLNHHPSIAVWSGGNELESIILDYFFGPGATLDGYTQVFLELLIKCVYANSHSISYIPSSTYHGYLSLNFSSVEPQTPRWNNVSGPDYIYSNTDSYNYDAAQAFNYSGLPVGRFATEFGSISLPSIQSWRDAIPEDQLSMNSSAVLHHNRHTPFGATGSTDELSAEGIADATSGVQLWYPMPELKDPIANFSAWCWSTQVYQAEKYADEIAFYRRGSALRERQLGALFWQLNDLWVAPTWAAIESSGRTKVMYYSTKDIYEPVVVWPFLDDDTGVLDIWVISDLWSEISGSVKMHWTDWKGQSIKLKGSNADMKIPFHTGPLNGTKVFSYSNVSSLFSDSQAATEAVLSLSVTSNDGHKHASWFHAVPMNKAALHDPGLTLRAARNHESNTVKFTVTAETAVAAWVWLDFPSTVRGFFDDNGFWLGQGESRTVTFTVWDDFTRHASWIQEVTVRSIWDNTLKK